MPTPLQCPKLAGSNLVCIDGLNVAEPDVWWGSNGIDALIWPKPYTAPSFEPLVEAERDMRPLALVG